MFVTNRTTEYKVFYFNILSFIVLKLSLLLLLFFIILTVTLEIFFISSCSFFVHDIRCL